MFELLDDENDDEGRKKGPTTTVKQDAPQIKTKPVTSTVGKEHAVRKNDVPAKEPSKERSDRRPPRAEGDRPPRVEGERPPRRNREGTSTGAEVTNRGDRGPLKPEGRGRRDNKDREHGGEVEGAFKGAKRVFDRKSGTGRGKEVKKGGGGRGGWGKESTKDSWDEVPEKQEGTDENKPVDTAEKVEGSPVEAGPSAPIKEESDEEKKRQEEEEKKKKEEEEKEQRQMTLEDYRKKLEAERAEKPTVIPNLPAPRQAGEGVDSKELQQWAKFTEIKREETEEQKIASAEAKKGKKEPKKQAVPVDTVFRVQQPKKPRPSKEDRFEKGDRPDRDRGDRPDRDRGDRPERDRGERPERDRGERAPRKDFKDREFNKESPRGPGKRPRGAAAPDVQDASSFPALSTQTKA